MKHYFTIGLILSGLLPLTLKAQMPYSSKKDYKLMVSFSDEYSGLSFSSLNHKLTQHGLPTVKRPVFLLLSLTAFPTSFSQRSFFGIQFGAAESKKDNTDYLTKLNLYLFNVNFYHPIWHTQRSMVYPALGLGWMHDILFLQNKSKTPPSFDEALMDFQGGQRLMADNFSLNLSFFYTWAVSKEKDFLINAHVGYRLGLNHSRWKLETGEGLRGSPQTSASGLFAGIGFSL